MDNLIKPAKLRGNEFRFDSFDNGQVLLSKKKNHLPAMGWNSWNAFGSGNTEELTKIMADRFTELSLDKLGYEYIVLDDGCYKPKRVDGKVSNEEVKFPSGFRALADYIHGKGLKFGMYNDIGTNLCAGALVGTCGYEDVDAASYIGWGVDFLKVDNCYYLWDNATFSNPRNAKYVFAPNIKGIRIEGNGVISEYRASGEGRLTGCGAYIENGYVTHIGTFDGTGPDSSPVGPESGELVFDVDVEKDGVYSLYVTYATGETEGCGAWLQAAIGEGECSELVYDDFLPVTLGPRTFSVSFPIKINLKRGNNVLRLMNHRRQENTLASYAALLDGLNKADPNHDVIFSLCEWGKTQPQNWAKKVGDSWRILNDITFRVGRDGNPGHGSWVEGYTTSVTSQYNKCVIMDEFAGLDKGWNDPDMMMIGMEGLDLTMCKSHMTMWSMMNSPLMLGLDLRRVKKGDDIYNIISNKDIIALNQDALGVQAKRVFCSLSKDAPDKEYVRDIKRVDILAKPLCDGSVAVSFLNVNNEDDNEKYSVDVKTIVSFIGGKMTNAKAFETASKYHVTDLWTKEESENATGVFEVSGLKACDNVTIKVSLCE